MTTMAVPDSARYQRVKQLVLDAADLRGEARTRFLDDACGDDAELRQLVQQRLDSMEDDDSGEFLKSVNTPGAALRANLDNDAPTSDPLAGIPLPEIPQRPLPERIGRYRVLELIGTGGMGQVYVAMQEEPRRKVALKVMRSGIASRSALRRFQFEAQTLGRLRHPNIAQVYEAGTHYETSVQHGGEGTPFFAMEYIPGALPVTEYVDTHQLELNQRLQLFVKICDAVHFGHQKGIIHRDLKPANILVAADGEPKIIDFGVARATDSDMAVTTQQTNLGQLIGTLQYMSPEQCHADPDDIDTRSDVYALGVVLYELMCDRLPYDVSQAHIFEATRIVCEQPPQRPSMHDRTLHGDIDTILTKALEKDRNRRYHSAHDLAIDIRRYLGDEPILARPPSVSYQLVKFARRNRGLVAAAVAVLLTLVFGFIVATTQAVRARKAETLAIENLDRAQRAQTLANQQKQEAERQAAISAAVVKFLNDDLLASVDPFNTPNPDITMREVLDEASQGISTAFEDEPEIEAAIRDTLASTYENVGNYAEAESHYETALAIQRTLYGSRDPRTLKTRHELAWVHRMLGRYDEAEEALLEVFEARKEVLGPEHVDTLRTQNYLGSIYSAKDEYDTALELLTDVLEKRESLLGPDHHATLQTINNLAVVYGELGRHDEATAMMERCAEGHLETLGIDHPITLTVMNNLAYRYIDEGDYDKAESAFQRVVEGRRRVLGDQHPSTARAIVGLATTLNKRGRYVEEEPLRHEALAIRREAFGNEHPDTINAMMHLGGNYIFQRRFEEAETTLREAYETAIPTLGLAHPTTITAMKGYGRALEKNDKTDEALSIYLELLSTVKSAYGEDHEATAFGWGTIGHFYRAEEMFTEAQEAFEEAARIYDLTRGPDHPDTLGSRNSLAMCLVSLDEHDDALAVHRDVLNIRTGKWGPDHPDTLVSLGNVANTLIAMDQYDEAVPILEDLIERADRTYTKSHEYTGRFRATLGGALRKLERYEQSEPILLEAHEILLAAVGEDHPQTTRAARMLELLYEAWERPEDAAKWRAPSAPDDG